MVALDCDYVSDSYACVFRRCNGYQAPFPIVRLASNHASESCTHELTNHPCITISTPDDSEPGNQTAFLLSLKLSAGQPCASFVELMNHSDVPTVRLSVNNQRELQCFTELETFNEIIASVQHKLVRDVWESAIWHHGSTGIEVCLLPSVSTVSLSDSVVWGAALQSNYGTIMCFDSSSLFNKSATPSYFLRLPETGIQVNNIAASHENCSLAAAFRIDDVVRIDNRAKKLSGKIAQLSPLQHGEISSGGMAGSFFSVCYTTKHQLMVFDLRNPMVPLLSRSSSDTLKVKSYSGEKEVLLISSNQIGLFDTDLLSMRGAIPLPDRADTVLDAEKIQSDDSLLHIRVSTSRGMLYDLGLASELRN